MTEDHHRQQRRKRTGADATDGEYTRLHRRKLLGITAGGLSVGTLGSLGSVAGQDDDAADTVTILHDTHTHSNVGEVGEPPNIATYRTKLDELFEEYENPIFVGNGDDLGPSLESLFTDGGHIIDFLNELPMTSNTIGNHEFDYGEENATAQFERSEFPWVSADLGPEEGEPVPGAERWIIENADGVDVGIFGLAPPDITGVTSYPEDWVELDKVEAAREATDALLEDGADVVVCASHTNTPVHFDLAEEIDELDAVVGSHWAEVYDEDEIRDQYDETGTVVSEVGDEFDYIGAVTLDAETGELVDWERHPTEDAEEDPEFVEMMEELQAEIDEELDVVVGETTRELDADRTYIESRDTLIGNVTTDMMIDFFDRAEISLMNEGGFRGGETYGPGEMTLRDWTEVFAFGNTLTLFEIDGATLVETLRYRGVIGAEGQAGRPDQQVGGLQFEWNPHDAEPDEDVHGGGYIGVENVYVDGEPLDPDETYWCATNNWVKESDGGYVPIHDLPTEEESDVTLAVAMGQYMEDQGVIDPELDHRMLRADEDVGEQTAVDVSADGITVTFDEPETGLDIHPDTFEAVTNHHESVGATDAWLDDGALHVRFDREELRSLVTDVEYVNPRVFGGYEPDLDQYEYDTPGTEAWDHHVLRGDIDPSSVEDGEPDEEPAEDEEPEEEPDEIDPTLQLSVTAPDSIARGESANFDVTVWNHGDDATEVTVTLEIGDVVESSTVEIAAGDCHVSFHTVAGSDLCPGDNEWTVTADGETESGVLTVTDG